MLMFKVLQMFRVYDDVEQMERYGHGFINRTYFVKGKNDNYILQMLETSLFENIEKTMETIKLTVDYLVEKYPDSERFEDLETSEGQRFIKLQNTIWHGFKIPKNYRLFKKVISCEMMGEIGKALATFHKTLLDFPQEKLSSLTGNYKEYDKLYYNLNERTKTDTYNRTMEAFNEIKFIRDFHSEMLKLKKIINDKILPTRVSHNNIRLNNILFEEDNYNFVAVIGYDVVSPGSILYDIADVIKHLAVNSREDETNFDLIQVDLNYFAFFMKEYLAIMEPYLEEIEIENIIAATRMAILEEAIRYTIDYLENDRVYKIEYKTQNLDRARNKVYLIKDIERKKEALLDIIKDARNKKTRTN